LPARLLAFLRAAQSTGQRVASGRRMHATD